MLLGSSREVTSKGVVDTVLLQQLMEELNDGYTVPAAEVKAVLEEADALAAGGSGRQSLLRAISAWYLHVQRSDSSWAVTLRACYGRWVPKKGYHQEVGGGDSEMTGHIHICKNKNTYNYYTYYRYIWYISYI